MYRILPETENHTLEDIERHFSDDSKKMTDIKIFKSNEMILSDNVDGSAEKLDLIKETGDTMRNCLENDSDSDSENSGAELNSTEF